MGSSLFNLLTSGPGTRLFNPDGTPGSGAPVSDSFDPVPTLLASAASGAGPGMGAGGGMSTLKKAGSTLTTLGLVTSILGGVNSAIGTFYAAKTQQYEDKSQASGLAFQSDMAAINSSRAEMTAESIEEAGKSQIANYTMQAGQQKANATASMASRGIVLGQGSAADVAASMDVEKSLNVMAINSNSVRQAWAAREEGTNYENQSLIDRTNSINAMRTGNSVSPIGNSVNSLLGSATKVASTWDYSRWLQQKLAQGSPVTQIGIGG